jgi:hypothetical protein
MLPQLLVKVPHVLIEIPLSIQSKTLLHRGHRHWQIGGRQEIPGKRSAEPTVQCPHDSRAAQTFGFLCYNLIHRAGTDALVTFSRGVHGVRFASDF